WLAMGVSTWLAAYTAPLAVVAAGWALTARQRDYRRVLWVLAGGLLVTSLLTLSRGGILALAVSVTIWVLIRAVVRLRSSNLFERRNLPLLGLFGAVAVVALAAIVVIGRNPGRIAGDALRLNLWNSASAMIGDHPLLGVGTGMFGRAVRIYRDPTVVDERLSTAHNIVLNTTAEIGLIGLALCLIMGVILLRTWLFNWRHAETSASRLRQEAVYAALIGFGVQSLVDNFMLTAVVSVFLVLLAYSIVGQRLLPIVTSRAVLNRLAAVTGLLVIAGYGVWLVTVDWADLNFRRSLVAADAEALTYAETAAAIDPGLRLYDLQVAYLTAEQSADAQSTITAYESALQLEPTWTTGWLNLAALAESDGDVMTAQDALKRAAAVNYENSGWLHWARLSEAYALAEPKAILDAYLTALAHQEDTLPLSPFWAETTLRQQAVEQYRQTLPLDLHYRIVAVHNPELRATLVPQSPRTAAEWWVAGEYALTMDDNPAQAVSDFTEAIAHDWLNGDYYVSRARARISLDPDAAQRDLNLADLLGTKYEYPNAVRAKLAQSPEEIYQLRVAAVPPQIIDQNFEGVLFSRTADFEVTSSMRLPGPGTAAMQPWYDIAVAYEADGDLEGAARVYKAILDYAPYEQRAMQELERLTN
ncbi:MAG: O-antigen ligase family protein, partial [Anaerolineae bacterium]|nr:O-antigen ligase family protein [Anaerolineae bacterium]